MSDDRSIDYYFTVTSPWSYLGHEPFLAITRRHPVQVRYHPVDFGAVFAVSGGLPLPKRAPQRQRYRLFELQRWRARRDAPMNLHPRHFPTDPSLGVRTLLVVNELGADTGAITSSFMQACWVEERDVADPAVLTEILDRHGLDGRALVAQADEPRTRERAEAETEAAKKAQVFGAPSWIYRGELFWGQDRLDMLEELIAGVREPFAVDAP